MTTKQPYIVVGLGSTGFSCIRYLQKKHIDPIVLDTRAAPPQLGQLKAQFPHLSYFVGETWPEALHSQSATWVVSPGVSIQHPFIRRARENGSEIIGDIELFARFNRTPVIAITGSNGKSTVTQLVGEMAQAAGKKVAIVGNIGTPVLDVIQEDSVYDLIVMELSSFQLETTYSLKPLVATVLNVTPDHMDRYSDLAEYAAAKHRIYHRAQQVVINKQDPLSESSVISSQATRLYFTLSSPQAGEWGLATEGSDLAYGNQILMPCREIPLMGQHNVANALSALALGNAAGLRMDAMCQALVNFKGLAHRCQQIALQDNIRWINDSKGTNIGATLAALQGIGALMQGKLILLLGGDGKGADFSELASPVAQYCRATILMGRDASIIQASIANSAPCHLANDMAHAVQLAKALAVPGDIVLLSPACASWDQYRDYQHRGEVFTEHVLRTLGLNG